ncbi:MAG: DUF1418 family protein [Pseudomonadota bacterium]
MSKSTGPLPIPLHLIVLDTIGMVLVGIGLYELFSDAGLVPENLRFEGFETVFISVGLLLMAPLVVHLVRKVTTRSARGKEI